MALRMLDNQHRGHALRLRPALSLLSTLLRTCSSEVSEDGATAHTCGSASPKQEQDLSPSTSPRTQPIAIPKTT